VTKVTTYDVVCNLCGKTVKADQTRRDAQPDEAHVYDADGVCEKCGARKASSAPRPGFVVVPGGDDDDDDDDDDDTRTPAATRTPSATRAPAAPAERELIETMESLGDDYQAAVNAGRASVAINHIEQVLTPQELDRLSRLPVREQLLVALAAVGFDSEVLARSGLLSPDAVALIDEIAARLNAMSDQDRAALEQFIRENFPVKQVALGGVTYPYFVVELVVTENGVTTTQEYGFRQERGQWLLTRL